MADDGRGDFRGRFQRRRRMSGQLRRVRPARGTSGARVVAATAAAAQAGARIVHAVVHAVAARSAPSAAAAVHHHRRRGRGRHQAAHRAARQAGPRRRTGRTARATRHMKTAAGSTGTGRRHSLHRCRHVGRRPVRLAAVFVVLVVVAATASATAADDHVATGHAAVVAPTVAAAADDVQRRRQERDDRPRIAWTATSRVSRFRRSRPPTGLDVRIGLHYRGKAYVLSFV